MDSTIKIAFTGHRYLSLQQVEAYLGKLHEDFPDAVWITGGAVGLDSHAASFAMRHKIRLWLILPFPPKVMTRYWSQSRREVLERLVAYCEKLSVLSPSYDKSIYQRRNERMVDWDGSRGGTGNCVGYARKPHINQAQARNIHSPLCRYPLWYGRNWTNQIFATP